MAQQCQAGIQKFHHPKILTVRAEGHEDDHELFEKLMAAIADRLWTDGGVISTRNGFDRRHPFGSVNGTSREGGDQEAIVDHESDMDISDGPD